MHISDCCQFSDIHISQGSVATYLSCGGMFKYDFVANLQLSLSAKELWKSVIICGSCVQEFSVLLFIDSRCIRHIYIACSYHQRKTDIQLVARLSRTEVNPEMWFWRGLWSPFTQKKTEKKHDCCAHGGECVPSGWSQDAHIKSAAHVGRWMKREVLNAADR